MQTNPATLPTSAPVSVLAELSPWIQFGVGFLLIGLAASLVTAQLRAALPEPKEPRWRLLHYLYPSLFGSGFASAASFALPGFGVDSRWIFGIVAPYLLAPIYDLLRKKFEKDLGITLPSSGEIAGVKPPTTPPLATPGGNNGTTT